MSAIHLPLQRPAPGPASADAAPAGDPGWSRVLLVAGSRAVLAVVLSLVVWSVLPAALGWSPRVIMSGSMEPRIHVGDVVVDRPTDAGALVEGRIITVTDPDHPEKTRTHRLQERDGAGMLVTKGDANEAADSTPVAPADVLGVGVVRVPWVGLPMAWIAQGQLAPVGIVVTLLLLLGLAATAPLRLTGAGSDDEQGKGPEDPDDRGPGGGTHEDVGLDVLGPGPDAGRRREEIRARVRRPGGRSVVTRSLAALGPVGPRGARSRVLGVAVGAVLVTSLTTQTTYAALSTTTQNPSSSFGAAAVFGNLDYAAVVRGDAPLFHWRMDEGSGSRLADAVGTRTALLQGGRWGWPEGALLGEPAATGLSVDGTEVLSDRTAVSGSVFSVEVWLRTSSTSGGPLLALATGNGVDRALYVGSDGRARFGRLGVQRVVSPAAVTDGQWHHVVYTNANAGSSAARGKLYVDGQLVAQGSVANASVTGYWDAGSVAWGSAWPGNPGQAHRGDLDEIAVYGDVLTPAEVMEHYAEAGR